MADSLNYFKEGKIILGSVQFGMHYGISNKDGSPEDNELASILKLAENLGLRVLDTASVYGKAEERLGKFSENRFEFVSKFKDCKTASDIHSSYEKSISLLKSDGLYGFLFHDFQEWKRQPELWAGLLELKESQQIKKIGCSLYNPEELQELLDASCVPDLIQIPFNLYDRRFESMKEEIQRHGIEVHARSAFLQGLMFFEPDEMPSHFEVIREKHRKFKALCEEMKLSTISASLGFVLQQSWIKAAVVGVNTKLELSEMHHELQSLDEVSFSNFDFMEEQNTAILNPANWR